MFHRDYLCVEFAKEPASQLSGTVVTVARGALVRASSWLAQSRGLATIRARHPETGIARLIGVQVYFAVCIAM